MFHPSSNTARTHAHTSISTLKSLVNFCSRDFLFHKEFDDSTLAKRHIVVGHFVTSDTNHVMQAIDVTRHSRITQQLVPSTTALFFVCCFQFACQKMLLMTFGTALVVLYILSFKFLDSNYPLYWRSFLHPQPEDAPCRGDGTHKYWKMHLPIKYLKEVCLSNADSCLPNSRLLLNRTQTVLMYVKFCLHNRTELGSICFLLQFVIAFLF